MKSINIDKGVEENQDLNQQNQEKLNINTSDTGGKNLSNKFEKIENNNMSIIGKISSKYIINNIFDYIGNNIIKAKLFQYSKLLRSKFDIQIREYQLKNYINRINNIFYKYLFEQNNFIFCHVLNQNNDDYLDNKFKEVLDNVKNIFNETNSDKINEKFKFPIEIKIETLNTYFDLLLQLNLLDKFSIGIDNNIYSKNLQDKYKLFFNKINELNINYPPIKIKCENELSNILKDINIDLLKIKIARVITDKPYNYYYFNNYLNSPPTSNEFSNSFMKIICSFSNLIYLDFAPEVDNPYYLYNPNKTNNDKRILTNESFDLINNLNNLKYLKVYSIDVNKKGILNLNNIISLNIAFSSNISFTLNFFVII